MIVEAILCNAGTSPLVGTRNLIDIMKKPKMEKIIPLILPSIRITHNSMLSSASTVWLACGPVRIGGLIKTREGNNLPSLPLCSPKCTPRLIRRFGHKRFSLSTRLITRVIFYIVINKAVIVANHPKPVVNPVSYSINRRCLGGVGHVSQSIQISCDRMHCWKSRLRIRLENPNLVVADIYVLISRITCIFYCAVHN